MKNSRGGFITPLLLVIIAVVLVGGGIYAYIQKGQEGTLVVGNSPIATPTKQTSDSENHSLPQSATVINEDSFGWKTYHNTQYGFSFEYPASFGNVSETTSLEHNFVSLERAGGGGYMIVYFPYVLMNQLTKQPITFDDFTGIYDTNDYNKISLIVGGIQSVSLSSPHFGRVVYVPLSNNQIIEIDGPRNDEVFDQILSTFKFNQ